MTRHGLRGIILAALLAVGCATGREVVELTSKGPSAEDLFQQRSLAINGRAPSFFEKRRWEAEVEERVYAYLRQHPELEQTSRYLDFRFWWQVTTGSTPAEVLVLLQEPAEQTVDPARMAALAERQWPEIQGKVREAWLYAPRWVIYFDETSVVAIVQRVSPVAPRE
jgi:hypothetical protein